MRKKFALASIAALCVGGLIYFAVTTNLIGGENLYERFGRDYKLQEDELLYGNFYFHKDGIAPVRIERISITNKKNIPIEVKFFFCGRQSMQMTGGPIKKVEFETDYGENLSVANQVKWLKDKEFQIVVTTKEDKLEGIWLEVEYSVLGMFKKRIQTEELIV